MVIERIKIYGERVSGTRYMGFLMEKNFQLPVVQPMHSSVGGWKHGPPNLTNMDTSNTLIIVMFRDALDALDPPSSGGFEKAFVCFTLLIKRFPMLSE